MAEISDFLDLITPYTYALDVHQEQVAQMDVDMSKGQALQVGFIADELENHKLFKYIGQTTSDGLHAISLLPLITLVISGYKEEKKKRQHLEDRVRLIESHLNL